jgi:glycosyltransferase involved in cell wall biosynthesis
MKVLFNCHVPFSLAHGGAEIQIQRSKSAVETAGISTDYLKWWEDEQPAEIIHHFGAIPWIVVEQAHKKGLKVVNTLLLTDTCNRPAYQLALRRLAVRIASVNVLPTGIRRRLPWTVCRSVDRMVVGLEAEKRVLQKVYGVAPDRISVVPLGLGESFLNAGVPSRGAKYLICTGTISPAKRSVELARLARESRTPILFAGKPFSTSDPYWEQFRAMIDDQFVMYHSHVSGEQTIIDLLKGARGYVLMSRSENWSLAAHEAAACGLPLLLPDQPWSRERFGSQACYFPKRLSKASVAALRDFYNRAPELGPPAIRLQSWAEVGRLLRGVYEKLIGFAA